MAKGVRQRRAPEAWPNAVTVCAGMGGFDKATERREKRVQQVDPREIFPQLSCLNKDDMMSHAMVIPITKGELTIGRTQEEPPNDFEIDGALRGRGLAKGRFTAAALLQAWACWSATASSPSAKKAPPSHSAARMPT